MPTAPKKKYAMNKTDIYHIDDTWSMIWIDRNDYGPQNNNDN